MIETTLWTRVPAPRGEFFARTDEMGDNEFQWEFVAFHTEESGERHVFIGGQYLDSHYDMDYLEGIKDASIIALHCMQLHHEGVGEYDHYTLEAGDVVGFDKLVRGLNLPR